MTSDQKLKSNKFDPCYCIETISISNDDPETAKRRMIYATNLLEDIAKITLNDICNKKGLVNRYSICTDDGSVSLYHTEDLRASAIDDLQFRLLAAIYDGKILASECLYSDDEIRRARKLIPSKRTIIEEY